jgi:hypothetical protein
MKDELGEVGSCTLGGEQEVLTNLCFENFKGTVLWRTMASFKK